MSGPPPHHLPQEISHMTCPEVCAVQVSRKLQLSWWLHQATASYLDKEPPWLPITFLRKAVRGSRNKQELGGCLEFYVCIT